MKKFLLILLFPAVVSAQTITDYIGYWPMDETSGDSVRDLSTNANNAYIFGGPTIVAGRIGNGRQFVAASSQYIESQYARTTVITTDWSIAFWINPTSTAADQYLVDGTVGVSQDLMSLILGFQNGFFNTYNTGYPGGSATNADIPADASAWQHIVYTSDGDTLRGYKDGAESFEWAGAWTADSPDDWRWGASMAPGSYFDGVMDELRIYNRALTAAEVTLLYNFGGRKQRIIN
jgi:hypothetical protein